MAIFAAMVMKQFIKTDVPSPFILELPSYKIPKWSGVFQNVFDRGKVFVMEAGRVILGISIVLWFLVSFPKTELPASFAMENSVENAENSVGKNNQMAASYRLQ